MIRIFTMRSFYSNHLAQKSFFFSYVSLFPVIKYSSKVDHMSIICQQNGQTIMLRFIFPVNGLKLFSKASRPCTVALVGHIDIKRVKACVKR